MKKLFLILCAAMLLFSFGMTCYASEATLNDEKNQQDIDVYAKYVVNDTDEFTAPVENGKSEIKLSNGITITVSGVKDNALTLVVMPIPKTDTEAWEWFSSCLSDKGEVIQPYDIYFVDSDGNRINADGVKITITLPGDCDDPKICSVTTSGTVKELDSTVKNGKITFKANGSHYYVIVGASQSNDPANPDDSDSPFEPSDTNNDTSTPDNNDNSKDNIDSDAPKTGEGSYLWLWIAAIASGAAIAFVLIIWKKKNKAVV